MSETQRPKVMSKGHFLTLVAKDTIVKKYGPPVKHWPDHNFWAMVSSVKDTIPEEKIPDLMKRYGISQLYEVQL